MIALCVISSAWFAMGIVVGVTIAVPSKRKGTRLTKRYTQSLSSQPKTYYLGEW
jgi:hypothetical protein